MLEEGQEAVLPQPNPLPEGAGGGIAQVVKASLDNMQERQSAGTQTEAALEPIPGSATHEGVGLNQVVGAAMGTLGQKETLPIQPVTPGPVEQVQQVAATVQTKPGEAQPGKPAVTVPVQGLK